MRILAVVVCLLALTACTSEKYCTLIGSVGGIGLTVGLPSVESATMEVCWDGSCTSPPVLLRPASANGPETCGGTGPDAVCGVQVVPAAGLIGFATVDTLPAKAVTVKLTLSDPAGAVLLDETLTVTPKMTYPNGEGCGGGAPQAGVKVSEAGLVTQRS